MKKVEFCQAFFVLDCGVFYSLANRMSKVEREAFGAEDLNGLWQTLQVKYNEHTPDEIARFWRTKTAMVRQIFLFEGRNGFPLPHSVAWREIQDDEEIEYVDIDV